MNLNAFYRSYNEDLGKYFYFSDGRYYKDEDCKHCISERICTEFQWSNAKQYVCTVDGEKVFKG